MNVDGAVAIVDELGTDALLLTSPQGFNWASGFQVASHVTMRWRHAGLLVDNTGLRAVLCVDMEESAVRSAFPDHPVYVWREFGGDLVQVLSAMIQEATDGAAESIAYEGDHIPVWLFHELTETLPRLEWVDCRLQVELGRARKTDAELERLQRLALTADTALHSALSASRVGDTEYSVAGRILNSLYEQGITEYKALMVASGERSWVPNVGPSGKTIQKGDVVRLEVFAMEAGYHAAVARTAFAGTPPDGLLDTWHWIRKSRDAGLAEMKPGADPRDVYAAYLDNLGPLRSRAISFFAHGMGLDLHELPYVTASSTDSLDVGAVLGIEPWAMLPGQFGLQIKDVAILRHDGAHVISEKLDGGELFAMKGR